MPATNSESKSSLGVAHVAPGEFRLRIAYQKIGRLRFLSHLEVLRAMERAARRADLPYSVTKGFSPHMKLAFGPALPVGTAGEREYVDIWLTTYEPAEGLAGRLREASVSDLAPVAAGFVAAGEPSLTAACTIAEYEVIVGGDGARGTALAESLKTLVDSREFAVEHKGKKKVFDLARSLPKEHRVESCGRGATVDLIVRMGPEGSLRPDVFVREAILRASIDASIDTVTRTGTLIEDSEGAWRRPL